MTSASSLTVASAGLALARTEPAHAAMDTVVTVAKYIRVAAASALAAAATAAAPATPPAATTAPAPVTVAAMTIAMNTILVGTLSVTALAEGEALMAIALLSGQGSPQVAQLNTDCVI